MINRLAGRLLLTCVAQLAHVPAAAQSVAPAGANPPTEPAPSRNRTAADAEPSGRTTAEGLLMFDYQLVPVRNDQSVDLLGFHVMTKVNDWMYLGIGGHTPLFSGQYGGFMVFDAIAHAQRKLFGNVFANAGVALGGGGGGQSVAQSRVISGTGGFIKAYAGIGYDFKDFSVGANLSKVKFTDSSINHSQLGLYVQVPFSYQTASFTRAGTAIEPTDQSDSDGSAPGENMLTLGVDTLMQIDPTGANKSTIGVGDLQFSHFMTKDSYWFFNAGAGYRGRPLYNQVFGGIGYRKRLAPQLSLYGQLAVGSGGYAPEVIDTGPGLLIYPKLSAEYLLTDNLGVTLSAGYLFAPRGTSKNYTVGAALNYHIHSGFAGPGGGRSAAGGVYSGYRFHLFQQTEFNVRFRNENQSTLKMLSIQMDKIVNDHVYIPLQVSGSYGEYLGYPGYGELVAGVGLQSRLRRGERFQYFGQLLLGANVHGPIIKTGIGLNYSLGDRLAVYAQAGQTMARVGGVREKFKADSVGVGVTYRFSVPSW